MLGPDSLKQRPAYKEVTRPNGLNQPGGNERARLPGIAVSSKSTSGLDADTSTTRGISKVKECPITHLGTINVSSLNKIVINKQDTSFNAYCPRQSEKPGCPPSDPIKACIAQLDPESIPDLGPVKDFALKKGVSKTGKRMTLLAVSSLATREELRIGRGSNDSKPEECCHADMSKLASYKGPCAC